LFLVHLDIFLKLTVNRAKGAAGGTRDAGGKGAEDHLQSKTTGEVDIIAVVEMTLLLCGLLWRIQ
jgi:hypothetical protein